MAPEPEPRTSGSAIQKRSRERHDKTTYASKRPKRRKLATGSSYKGDGLKNSFHGVLYQIKLLMLFLKRGVDQGYTFMLGSEVKSAEKFDDVVFKYEEDGTSKLRFLQAKHKQEDQRNVGKLTRQDIVRQRSPGKKQNLDFSIQKYFVFFQIFKHRNQEEYLKGEIQNFTIYTNLDIEEGLESSFCEIEMNEDPLIAVGEDYGARRLKLKQETPLYNDLVKILSETDTKHEYEKIIQELGTMVAKNKFITVKNKQILKDNRHWIMQNVFNLETKTKVKSKYFIKFHDDFLTNPINEMMITLNDTFFKYYNKYSGREDDKNNNNIRDVYVQIAPSLLEGVACINNEYHNNHSNSLNENIKFFLDKLIFAVKQPTESQLRDIIEDELADFMNVTDGELASSIMQTRLQDWFKTKDGAFLTMTDCHGLLKDIEKIIASLAQTGFTMRSKNKIKDYRCFFRTDCDMIKSLNDFFSQESKKLLLIKYTNRVLTETKLVQLKQETKCDKYMYSYMKEYLNVFNTVACPVKAFDSSVCEQMFIVFDDDSDLKGTNLKLLEMFLNIVKHKNNKKVVIIVPAEIYEKFKGTATKLIHNIPFEEKHDLEIKYEDLDLESQANLRQDAKLVFQGYQVNFGELLESDGDILECVRDETLSSLVVHREYQLDIKERRDEYSKTKKYYVDRRVKHADNDSKILNNVNDIDYKTVMISGEPGSGKSSLLSHVAVNTRKLHLDVCVIKAILSAPEHTKLLSKMTGKCTQIKAIQFLYVLFNLKAFAEILNSHVIFDLNKFNSKLNARNRSGQISLHLNLFKYLYNNKKIVLLLDAYDEIAPIHAQRVKELLVEFKRMRIQKIWVTTRPYGIEDKLKRNTKKDFGAMEYILMPLNADEQKLLLQRYGINTNFRQFQGFCKSMIHISRVEHYNQTNEFLGIPHQLIMASSIYCEEHAKPRSERKTMTRYEFYQKAIDYKFKKIYDKIDPNNQKFYEKKDNEKNKKSLMTRHEKLALIELYADFDIPKKLVSLTAAKQLRAKVKKADEKMDLVIANDKPRFVHRTYAEYFAARCLADAIYPDRRPDSRRSEVKKFLYTIMCSGAMSGLCLAFFNYRIIDRMLEDMKKKKNKKSNKKQSDNVVSTEKDADIFKAAIEGDIDVLYHSKLTILRDAIGRAPLHLFLYNCPFNEGKDFFEQYLPCSNSSTNGALLSETANSPLLIKDKLFKWTPLHYCVLFGSLFRSESGLKINGIPNGEDFKDEYEHTPRMLGINKV